jgi:hypothetical protein
MMIFTCITQPQRMHATIVIVTMHFLFFLDVFRDDQSECVEDRVSRMVALMDLAAEYFTIRDESVSEDRSTILIPLCSRMQESIVGMLSSFWCVLSHGDIVDACWEGKLPGFWKRMDTIMMPILAQIPTTKGSELEWIRTITKERLHTSKQVIENVLALSERINENWEGWVFHEKVFALIYEAEKSTISRHIATKIRKIPKDVDKSTQKEKFILVRCAELFDVCVRVHALFILSCANCSHAAMIYFPPHPSNSFAIYCGHQCVIFAQRNDLGNVFEILLPHALSFLDDFRMENRRLGFRMLDRFMNVIAPADFRLYADYIFETCLRLTKCTHPRHMSFRMARLCRILFVDPEEPRVRDLLRHLLHQRNEIEEEEEEEEVDRKEDGNGSFDSDHSDHARVQSRKIQRRKENMEVRAFPCPPQSQSGCVI